VLASEGRNGSGGEKAVLELRADELKELIGEHGGLLKGEMILRFTVLSLLCRRLSRV